MDELTPAELKEEKLKTIRGVRDARNVLRKQKDEVESRIGDCNRLLAHLWKTLDICETCEGDGEYFARACAEDEGEMKTCRDCHGDGKYHKRG